MTGPPKCLFAWWRWTRILVPLELHLGDLGSLDAGTEEIHS